MSQLGYVEQSGRLPHLLYVYQSVGTCTQIDTSGVFQDLSWVDDVLFPALFPNNRETKPTNNKQIEEEKQKFEQISRNQENREGSEGTKEKDVPS